MNVFDHIKGLENVNPEDLKEFQTEMEEKVIPALIEKRKPKITVQDLREKFDLIFAKANKCGQFDLRDIASTLGDVILYLEENK